MRPTTAPDDNVIDLNAILHPGTVFEHPRDVVSDPGLQTPIRVRGFGLGVSRDRAQDLYVPSI